MCIVLVSWFLLAKFGKLDGGHVWDKAFLMDGTWCLIIYESEFLWGWGSF
jgi:hypothetical protein